MLIAKSTRNGSFSIAMLHTPTIPNTCLPDVSGSPAQAKSLAASVLAGLGGVAGYVMWFWVKTIQNPWWKKKTVDVYSPSQMVIGYFDPSPCVWCIKECDDCR